MASGGHGLAAAVGDFTELEKVQCEPHSRTMNSIAANPANNTPLSSETEMRCNRPNSASSGLSSAVTSIDPICTRSTAILGLTPTCEATVNAIISTTQSATGVTKLAN